MALLYVHGDDSGWERTCVDPRSHIRDLKLAGVHAVRRGTIPVRGSGAFFLRVSYVHS
jgi:hypothetical protein